MKELVLQYLLLFLSKKMKNKERLIFIIVFVFAVIAPIVFSQFYTGISFVGLGEIGDVIGGTTAPFIGFGGMYLMYRAFKVQYLANEEFKDVSKDDFIRKDIEVFENARKESLVEFVKILDESNKFFSKIYREKRIREKLKFKDDILPKIQKSLNNEMFFFLILEQYNHKMGRDNMGHIKKGFTQMELRMDSYINFALKEPLLEIRTKLEILIDLINKIINYSDESDKLGLSLSLFKSKNYSQIIYQLLDSEDKELYKVVDKAIDNFDKTL